MAIVVALSGPVAVGKTTLAERLASQWPTALVKTREEIARAAAARGRELGDRRDFQEFGDELDRSTDGAWVAEAAAQVNLDTVRLLIVDAIRIEEQVHALRERFGRGLVHVHLEAADLGELARRYRERRPRGVTMTELRDYDEVRSNATEAQVDSLARIADVVLDTQRNTEGDLVIRCAARLGLLPSLTAPLVDVLVGGQYGSEGKGNISYYLAPEYDVLARVGGPNAGHKVRHDGAVLTHRSLPSGATANPEAPLLIGPGAAIAIDVLMDELANTRVDPRRVHLDPQVVVITPEDREREVELRHAIRSTAEGVGSAAARRILGRGEPTKLARDFPELAQFIAPTSELLNEAFAHSRRVLVEGTQGTGLSLFHGTYPYVTSRDTTVAGTLAEMGIGPRRVRRAIMVARTYPIRVAGNSGPIGAGRELTWPEIEERSGEEPGSITELSSVTRQQRRVAEFDWQLLRRSAELNSATDVALTFADYINVKNRRAYRYEQLSQDTLQFVEEIESVTGAAVSLIATDFSERAIIDRRTWRAVRK